MVNLEHKLTVDDLIVEYMMYKVKNGYEPNFLASEFMQFLSFFESKKKVEDTLYERDKLFNRFFERKIKNDWFGDPNMTIKYSEENKDFLISDCGLSNYDRSVINTYFMAKTEVDEIRNIIKEFLSNYPKRKIDYSIIPNDNELMIGKYVAAEIITQIWHSHISKQIEYKRWPEQCNDINKYLFDIDLAEIIGAKSIKKELIELYNVLSKRVAILYKQDRNLKISSYDNTYLSRANYELLIQGYEEIIGIAFNKYNKSLNIDLSKLTFTETHEIDGVYDWDEDPDVKNTTLPIGNENAKKLVKNLEKYDIH